MTDEDREPTEARELADAATVHAVREDIVQALGPLAASPLDEQAVERMRRALARADSPAVRAALRRLRVAVTPPASRRPFLASIPSIADRAPGLRPPAPRSQTQPCQLILGPSAGGAA